MFIDLSTTLKIEPDSDEERLCVLWSRIRSRFDSVSHTKVKNNDWDALCTQSQKTFDIVSLACKKEGSIQKAIESLSSFLQALVNFGSSQASKIAESFFTTCSAIFDEIKEFAASLPTVATATA